MVIIASATTTWYVDNSNHIDVVVHGFCFMLCSRHKIISLCLLLLVSDNSLGKLSRRVAVIAHFHNFNQGFCLDYTLLLQLYGTTDDGSVEGKTASNEGNNDNTGKDNANKI